MHTNKNIAVFPGSFDPITKGHQSIIRRIEPLFDEIIIAIGENTSKQCYFSLEDRMRWLELSFAAYSKIRVASFNTLLIDYCKSQNARYILRGLRNSVDYQYERNIALINQELDEDIETLFLLTHSEDIAISSSFVKEIMMFDGDIRKFVPQEIYDDLMLRKKNMK